MGFELEDIIAGASEKLEERLDFGTDEALHGSAVVIDYLLEDLDNEQIDFLILELQERRRILRGDCDVECKEDHIHKRNGINFVTRTVPLRRDWGRRK